MLVIRQAQINALQDLPRRNLETKLVRHFSKYYPREFSSAGPKEARRLVGAGIRRASNYGLLTVETAARFTHLMIILGWAFDSDPQLGWARERLTDYSLAPEDRMRVLFEATVDYLGQVAGEKSEKVVRAMLRIRKHDFLAPWAASGDEFRAELKALLARFYPEKAAIQGEDGNQLLVQRAELDARKHGFAGANGIAVYGCLAFMLGTGFDTDPLYWWAGKTLRESEGQPESERVKRLVERALKHVEASLRGLEETDGR